MCVCVCVEYFVDRSGQVLYLVKVWSLLREYGEELDWWGRGQGSFPFQVIGY